jgi:hypothetical protein
MTFVGGEALLYFNIQEFFTVFGGGDAGSYSGIQFVGDPKTLNLEVL